MRINIDLTWLVVSVIVALAVNSFGLYVGMWVIAGFLVLQIVAVIVCWQLVKKGWRIKK